MNLHKALLLAGAALVLVWGLGAKKDGGLKIGVVDLDQAITATKEGKSAREELERKQRDAKNRLMPLVERYQELGKELEAKQFVLSDEKLRERQLDMVELRNEIESKQAEMEGQLKIDFERIVGPLRNKLVGIIEDVGRQDGFSLILQRNSPGIMYSREALDVTDVIIERFNKES